jgi:hypothetical protein
MQSMVYVEQYVGEAASVYIDGDLKFQQRELIPAWLNRTTYDVPIVNWTLSSLSSGETTWKRLIKSYRDRADRTTLQYDSTTSGVRSGSQPFLISGSIRYPQDTYRYMPTWSEAFRWAWVGFVSFFFMSLLVLVPLVDTIYYHHFVSTAVTTDVTAMRTGGTQKWYF